MDKSRKGLPCRHQVVEQTNSIFGVQAVFDVVSAAFSRGENVAVVVDV